MSISDKIMFLSYVSPDRSRVMPVYHFLTSKGFNVWIDTKELKAGQRWDFEIRRALDKASIIIVFISNNSVSRRGYAQREIRLSLEKLEEKLFDDIYIIPVLLDEDAPVPEQLREVQFVRMNDDGFEQRIEEAIQHQMERIGEEIRQFEEESSVRWTFGNYHDDWDGLPGYEADFQTIDLGSEQFKNLSEISAVIPGALLGSVMSMRETKLEPSLDAFSYGQPRARRTNSYDAKCSDPVAVGNVISISHSVYTYHAGAAHPNHHFENFAFLLDPTIWIAPFEIIFTDPDGALPVVIAETRQNLLEPRIENSEDVNEDLSLDKDFVEGGTSNWGDFQNFIFREDHVEFLFPPYQVAAYAFGPQSATIPYRKILPFLRRPFVFALGLEHELLVLENQQQEQLASKASEPS